MSLCPAPPPASLDPSGHHAEEDEGQDEAAQHGADDAGVAGRGAAATSARPRGRRHLRHRASAGRLPHQSQQHHLLAA